ncbi:MAG: class I SAM-dependent methyltransferase [Chitinophagaceae bacterium]|nr:MAG: class I SAM-dependent methyltransferase [Chitinophagaceae bacterium]
MKKILYAFMLKHAEKPSGIRGRAAMWLWNRLNKQLSDWTIEKLNIKSNERILEVGYGSGYTLEKIASRLRTGVIAGVDHSPLMYHLARKRNQAHLLSNKVVLRCGVVDDFSYHRMYFDVIFGTNVHFFWDHPTQEFEKLRLLLKPGGRLQIFFQPRHARSDWELMRWANDCRQQVEAAGFSAVKLEIKKAQPVAMICITGYALKTVNAKESKKKRMQAFG